MKATVLECPPVSGTIEEAWFDVYGDTTWLLFELDDGTSFAGVFGDGYGLKRRATGAAVLSDDRTAVVLARGRGYVLDVVDRQIIRVLDGDTWSSVLAAPGRGMAVISDSYSLVAIDRSGELWRSGWLGIDGVILEATTKDMLTGKVWCWDGWYTFSLRFNGWVYERGDWLTGEWSAFQDPSG